MSTEHFIIGADNIITLTLTEDAAAIATVPTEINIDIGGRVLITRSPDGTGVTYNAGVLELQPSRMVGDDFDALIDGKEYETRVIVKSATETAGVVYGAGDSSSGAPLIFKISRNPV